MLRANVVPGSIAAAAAITVALLVSVVPAQGATGAPGSAGEENPTPEPTVSTTEDPTPTPTPTPAVTETPTPSPPAPTTAPPDDRLLPDLIALPASQPRVQVRRDGRLLRFTSSLGNVGVGPVEVRPNRARPCPSGRHNSTQIIYRDANTNARYNRRVDTRVIRHHAGCMVYHPYHQHWHFQASARYTLVDPSKDGRVVISARRKVSFCLRDSARLPARYGRFSYGDAYGSCTRSSPQGISVGWTDVYQRWLPGQSLRLPRNLRKSVYCLEITVDPLDRLLESNNRNNKSIRALAIGGNAVEIRKSAHCR